MVPHLEVPVAQAADIHPIHQEEIATPDITVVTVVMGIRDTLITVILAAVILVPMVAMATMRFPRPQEEQQAATVRYLTKAQVEVEVTVEHMQLAARGVRLPQE